MDTAELAFLEVGIDVELVDRDDGHDGLTGAQTLSHLNLQAAHHPGNRRANFGTLEVEQGGIEPGLGRLNRWVGIDARAAHQGVVGGKLPLRDPAG